MPTATGTTERPAASAPVSPPARRDRPQRSVADRVPGLAAAIAVAVVATVCGHLVPVLGGPVAAILLGIAVATVARRPGAAIRPGAAFAGKQVLQASIVVLGTGLSLTQVVRVGAASLPVMLVTLGAALAGAAVLGRLLGIGGGLRTLIGVGTAICGASAIAAVTAVVDVAEVEVAYAIGTIFTFNVVAVLLYPGIGHLLGLSQHAFGLWAGTAVNDTSSVVAAAFSYGAQAGAYGIVVKLTRSVMIIPVCVVLAVAHARRRKPDTAGGRRFPPLRRVLPVFLVGFLAASGIDTLGLIPAHWHSALSTLGVFLITVALAGIGLNLRLSELRRSGPRPLLLGAALWVLVGVTSLVMQAVTGTL